MKITLTKKSVNSKAICETIDTFIRELIDADVNFYDEEDRWIVVQETDIMMDELAESGKIIGWDVVFDARNNKRADMVKGHFNLIIKYVQYNCLNTSQLIYTFDMNDRKVKAEW